MRLLHAIRCRLPSALARVREMRSRHASDPRRALFLCTSPFQAFLFRRILRAASFEAFDVVFYTDVGGPKHRHYFSELSRDAGRAAYFAFDEPHSAVDRMTHFFPPWLGLRHYDAVFCAILHPWYFRAILAAYRNVPLCTLDDGTANLIGGGQPLLRFETPFDREVGAMLGLSLDAIVQASTCHYTIAPAVPQIFPNARIVPIDLGIPEPVAEAPERLVVIGTPLFDDMPADEMVRIEAHLAGVRYAYLPHPRERGGNRVATAANEVIDTPLVIEDLAAEFVASGHAPHFIGHRTTALLTFARLPFRRTCLRLAEDDPIAHLAAATGCHIVDLWNSASPRARVG